MKDLFILWIIIQLVILGMVEVNVHNEILQKTYDCKQEVAPAWFGAAFPLIIFVPDNTAIHKYCNR
jgi:hypothetical protein